MGQSAGTNFYNIGPYYMGGGEIQLHPVDHGLPLFQNTVYLDEQRSNELLLAASSGVVDTSHSLPQLYLNAVGSTGRPIQDVARSLYQTLEQRLAHVPDTTFKDQAAIDILVTLALNNGVSYLPSGSFEEAYTALVFELHKYFGGRSNPQVHNALLKLVEGGFLAQGVGYQDEPVLIATSRIDPYLIKGAESIDTTSKGSKGETPAGLVMHPLAVISNLARFLNHSPRDPHHNRPAA